MAKQNQLSPRTLSRWAAQYKKQGITGLCRKSRNDKGTCKTRSMMTEAIEAIMLNASRMPISAIHRRISKFALEKRLPVPSYSFVYKVVSDIEPALLSLAQQGSKKYAEQYDLIFRREATGPNAIWQADHTPLDIMVQGDKGLPERPWLSIIIDDYSRAVAGYFISFSAPSAVNTALVLRQAIWRKNEPNWPICGIPEILYTDHGSDFTSHHIEQVCLDLKIQLIFSAIGKPQGRGRIERFFDTVNQLFLCELPGYFGRGNKRSQNNLLTLNALDAAFKQFLLTEYHTRIHSTIGERPIQRWEENHFLPQLPESLEQLDLLLLTVAKQRKVHRDGIKFQGFRYLHTTLASYVGESVIIRYDPRDLAEIRVFYNDQYLCQAICQELSEGTISLKDITQAREKRKRELSKKIKNRKNLVDQFLQRPVVIEPSSKPFARTSSKNTDKKTTRLKRYENE